MFGVLTDDELKRHGRSDVVAARIRAAIREGAIKPGDRLTETALAASMGVSRTPIREAIEKLCAEGLLTSTATRGLIVTELSRSQLIQIYSLRAVLEGMAASLAAKQASEAEILDLRDIHEANAQLLESPDRLAEANREFHRAIYAAAHNEYLIQAAGRLADTLSLLSGTTFQAPDRPQSAQAEHAGILEAIAGRDADLAEARARRHIEIAQQIRLKQIYSGE